jgi:hypothetical protein
VEAASVPRVSTKRRRGPSRKAQWALVAYALAAFVALSILDGGTRTVAPATASPLASRGPAAPSSSDLSLTTVAARAGNSVVSVGPGSGFVAWNANGLALVLTSRPAGGWRTGPGRTLEVVTRFGYRIDGTLVRTDPRTGLGLVRVDGEIGTPLWQRRSPAPVRAGDFLVAAGRSPVVFGVTEARAGAIWGAPAGTAPGTPVLDESGRLVGVATGGRVVPIERACGVIRRC